MTRKNDAARFPVEPTNLTEGEGVDGHQVDALWDVTKKSKASRSVESAPKGSRPIPKVSTITGHGVATRIRTELERRRKLLLALISIFVAGFMVAVLVASMINGRFILSSEKRAVESADCSYPKDQQDFLGFLPVLASVCKLFSEDARTLPISQQIEMCNNFIQVVGPNQFKRWQQHTRNAPTSIALNIASDSGQDIENQFLFISQLARYAGDNEVGQDILRCAYAPDSVSLEIAAGDPDTNPLEIEPVAGESRPFYADSVFGVNTSGAIVKVLEFVNRNGSKRQELYQLRSGDSPSVPGVGAGQRWYVIATEPQGSENFIQDLKSL